jgi:septal ring factor EnvC (AmiA/AmiB activator)
MKSTFRHIFFLTCFVFAGTAIPIFGQTVKQLEEQRGQILKRLETTTKMLSETKKSRQSSLSKLTILSRTVAERRSLINTLNGEIKGLDNEMARIEEEKQTLEKRLNAAKDAYAKLVREANINKGTYAQLMFILSAENFNQSYRRLRYIQEYSNYQKAQVKEIEKLTAKLEEKAIELQRNKASKETVLTQHRQETVKLSEDEKQEKTLLNSLNKQEKRLKDDLRKQQKQEAELNKKIEKAIAEQIRKEEEKRRLAAERDAKKAKETGVKPTEANSAVAALTKEEKLLTGNFEKNKGRLPWPVERGFVSRKFGTHPHPVLKHVTTNCNGIYIQTTAGSNARAVYDGVVTSRFVASGYNNAVIIRHGEYRTIYANLTEIYVKEGDKVSAKQAIGKIYTDDENDNKTELYFQVNKDKSKQNPEIWITK